MAKRRKARKKTRAKKPQRRCLRYQKVRGRRRCARWSKAKTRSKSKRRSRSTAPARHPYEVAEREWLEDARRADAAARKYVVNDVDEAFKKCGDMPLSIEQMAGGKLKVYCD